MSVTTNTFCNTRFYHILEKLFQFTVLAALRDYQKLHENVKFCPFQNLRKFNIRRYNYFLATGFSIVRRFSSSFELALFSRSFEFDW